VRRFGVRLLKIHISNRIDRCSEDTKITTAMRFVNMVYNPTIMDGVLHSVSEREAFILDIIVAVHDGFRLKNAILLNGKRNHGRQHFVRNCELDIFAWQCEHFNDGHQSL
jgi:hypothetical protein